MNNEIISTMTEHIVRDFASLQIVLFGSHARGDDHPHSDVDPFVVFFEPINNSSYSRRDRCVSISYLRTTLIYIIHHKWLCYQLSLP